MWLINLCLISSVLSLGFAKPQQGFILDPTIPKPGQETTNNENCVCVFFYLCKNNTLVTDGRGILTPRLKSCPELGQVCCPYEDRLPNNTTTTTTTTQKTPTSKPTSHPVVTDGPKTEPPIPRTDKPKPVKIEDEAKEGCGYHNPDGISFRIKGSEDSVTEFGEFPWMVAVFLAEEEEDSLTYKCGGSLIHPRVVVTAAHCVVASKRGKKFKIRAGDWDLQSTDEISPHQERDVETVVMHKQYNSGTLRNDIALLFLTSPLTKAAHIDVMCLPPKGTVSTSQNCLASGWGRDKSDPNQSEATVLRRVDLPMVPHDKCQESLRKSHLGPEYNLHSTFVCAGGVHGKDTCKGDGGSPLMCPIPGQKDRYQQMGIVSWGIGCGDGATPSLFTNVAAERDWIDEQMTLKQLGANTYTY